MGLRTERVYPVSVGLVALVLACLFLPAPAEGMKDVIQSVVNTSAIAIGFLATSKSILYTIGSKRIMRDLQDAGYMGQVVDYFIESILAWFLLALAGGALLLLDYKNPIPTWGQWVLAFWCGLLVWSIATFGRVVYLLQKILKS